MNVSSEAPRSAARAEESRQNRLIIVLADISGYTDLMVANQTAAVHGQIVVSMLIESILKEVDIPLRLQEIEGDAVFLYAEHPGSESRWREVCDHVGRKLPRFFEAFGEAIVAAEESTICVCAVCKSKELRLKIVAHAGEAVFHRIHGRPQISGVAVIEAHRLLKNSVPSKEYILVTEAAHEHLRPSLDLEFSEREEVYEGLPPIRTFVHFPGDQDQVRREFYAQSAGQLAWTGIRYAGWAIVEEFKALGEQVRTPVAPVGPLRRVAYATLLVVIAAPVFLLLVTTTPIRLLVRRAGRG